MFYLIKCDTKIDLWETHPELNDFVYFKKRIVVGNSAMQYADQATGYDTKYTLDFINPFIKASSESLEDIIEQATLLCLS
jgi:hypothetical protein